MIFTFKGGSMKKSSLRQAWSLLLAMIALSLMLAQPLWAEENAIPQVKQEESFFASLKRDLDEWLGRKKPVDQAQNEAPKPAEPKPKPQKPSKQQSDGRKALNTFKKEMNKVSDNISESMERDKKTLKKKIDKLNSKK